MSFIERFFSIVSQCLYRRFYATYMQAKKILCGLIDEYLGLYIVKAGSEISKLCQKIIKDNDVILVYAL